MDFILDQYCNKVSEHYIAAWTPLVLYKFKNVLQYRLDYLLTR